MFIGGLHYGASDRAQPQPPSGAEEFECLLLIPVVTQKIFLDEKRLRTCFVMQSDVKSGWESRFMDKENKRFKRTLCQGARTEREFEKSFIGSLVTFYPLCRWLPQGKHEVWMC